MKKSSLITGIMMFLLMQLLSLQTMKADYSANPTALPDDFKFYTDVIMRTVPVDNSVGYFSPNDANYIYTLVSGDGKNDADNNKFRMEYASSGFWTGYNLIVNADLTQITKNNLNIYVQISDGQGNTKEKAFVIYLANGEMPADVVLSDTVIHESSAQGTFIGKLSTKDIDNDTVVSYSLVTGNGVNDKDNSKFIIENDTLKTAESFNSSTEEAYHIYIQARENDDILQDSVIESVADYETNLLDIYKQLGNFSDNQGKRCISIFGSQTNNSFSSYLRRLWDAEELPSDEAMCAWEDIDINPLKFQTWQDNDASSESFFKTIYYQISFCNEFIKLCSDEYLSGYTSNEKETIKGFEAEARFLRALSYYHVIDFFGTGPIITENDRTGDVFPAFSTRAQLFNYVESELTAILPNLTSPKANGYGRADKGTAWTLLAKLYLNAEVYIGTPKYTECVNYTNLIIYSGAYALNSNYQYNFLADNNTSPEIIFPIIADGEKTIGYGGMTYIMNAAGNYAIPNYGITGDWGGNRTFMELPGFFGVTESDFSVSVPELDYVDSRALFYFDPDVFSWTNLNYGQFTNGIGVLKYKNVNQDGSPASNYSETYPDVDFPMFRLADVYLMYAEAVLRGGTGGDPNAALGYVNALRERAYGDMSGNISSGELTLDFILDERARELYWEGHRRTDLVRFGKFTGGDYLWSWKGGEQNGTATSSSYNLYPAPTEFTHGNTFKQEFVLSYLLTSFEEPTLKNISIYPNPVKNILTVEGTEQNAELMIYSLKGELLKQMKIQNSRINLSSLAPNQYLIRVKDDKSDFSKVIIKE